MFKLNVGMVLGTLLLAAPAWSSLITVNNFSFESPVLVGTDPGVTTTAGFGLTVPTIAGWTITGTAGTYAPTTVAPTVNFYANATGPTHVPTNGAGIVPSTDGGAQVAFLKDGATIYQDLIAPLGGSLGYSLTVDIGHRLEITSPISYSIMLETSTGTVLATLPGTLSSIDAGYWSQRTLYFVGDDSTFVGQNLRVALSASGGANQVNFDNVQVDSGVPEIGGSAVFWTMFGVAGFWIYRKKRLVA